MNERMLPVDGKCNSCGDDGPLHRDGLCLQCHDVTHRCSVCGRPARGSVCFACGARLHDLIETARLGYRGDDNAVVIDRLVVTNANSQPHILVIDTNASGVQRPIAVNGSAKCIICDELCYDRLVCERCQEAIMALRRASSEEMRLILEVLENDLVRKWIAEQIEEI